MVGAMGSELYGVLYTRNPLTSGPQGYAYTMGFKTITAKCTVSKSGYTTRSVSASETVSGTYGGAVETPWITGPTYAASGTTFKSDHTGYSNTGVYQTATASKTF